MFAELAAPIVSLLNQLMGPLLLVVGALGSLYCVVLGVKYAKAEEPQEREKAKGALKGAVVGFLLIFVFIIQLLRFFTKYFRLNLKFICQIFMNKRKLLNF